MLANIRMHTALLATAIALGTMLAPNPGLAQSYPSRPIKLVVPTSPGGAPDVMGRTLAERLAPLLGQPVVVENRPGANGNIAMGSVANSAPDGYTLVIAHDSLLAVNPHLHTKTKVPSLKDFTPVAMIAASNSFLLVVPSALPVKNFQEFVEYARSASPPLAYASGGSGSPHHLAMEMLKLGAGIDLMHVPYKGGAPAVAATISSEVSAAITSSVTSVFVRAGKLRTLAVTGSSRLPSMPDVPTISEFYPGYHVSSWFGIFGPAGLPEPALAKLRSDIRRVLDMPEIRRRFHTAGEFEPYVLTPEEFTGRINADYEKYGKLVKQIGLRVD